MNFEIPIKKKTNKLEVIYKRKSKDQVRIEVPTKESPKLNQSNLILKKSSLKKEIRSQN